MSSVFLLYNCVYFLCKFCNMKSGGDGMILDYTAIGKRIAARRRALKMTQAQVSELADISTTYMSGIERATSIPSTEVIMRLAIALDTTPDEFLVGTAIHPDAPWRTVADQLRSLNEEQLKLAGSFIAWLREQSL